MKKFCFIWSLASYATVRAAGFIPRKKSAVWVLYSFCGSSCFIFVLWVFLFILWPWYDHLGGIGQPMPPVEWSNLFSSYLSVIVACISVYAPQSPRFMSCCLVIKDTDFQIFQVFCFSNKFFFKSFFFKAFLLFLLIWVIWHCNL